MHIDPTITTIWAEFSSTLQLVVKGLIIGIIVSAPMGPVGILCIQRTMHKGRTYGLVTGAGAALSDMIYALITGSGMALIMDFIERPEIIFWLKVVGSLLLLIFGLHTLLSNPIKAMRKPSGQKGTLFNNFVTSFLVTLSNRSSSSSSSPSSHSSPLPCPRTSSVWPAAISPSLAVPCCGGWA